MSEVDYLRSQMKDLEEKIKDEQQHQKANEVASKLRIFYDTMIGNGFTEEQAWWMITAVVKASWGVD